MTRLLLLGAAAFSVVVSLAILLALFGESAQFFRLVPVHSFLFGAEWSPQMAGVGGVQGRAHFGALPVLAGTFLIMLIAMLVALPLGLMVALYLTQQASARARAVLKPAVEMLAAIPSVVYGYMAVLFIAPFIRDTAQSLGLEASAESALAAGLIMGVMILPFVSSLADDVLAAVPKLQSDGAAALGLTCREVALGVLLPQAAPGLVGAGLLAVSRALGETMIVVMAAGLAARLTVNPLESVTTVTVQISTLLVGDQAFDNPKTLAAFALGLTLFMITLLLNFFALARLRQLRGAGHG